MIVLALKSAKLPSPAGSPSGGLSVSFKVRQIGSALKAAPESPGMGLLFGWVCEQGRTQNLIVLKYLPNLTLSTKT